MTTTESAALVAQLRSAVRSGADTHREARRLSAKLAAQVSLSIRGAL